MFGHRRPTPLESEMVEAVRSLRSVLTRLDTLLVMYAMRSGGGTSDGLGEILRGVVGAMNQPTPPAKIAP